MSESDKVPFDAVKFVSESKATFASQIIGDFEELIRSGATGKWTLEEGEKYISEIAIAMALDSEEFGRELRERISF